ncbi:hypothetical protein DFH07DRAFT_943437 [Mycena maculata]|uniref:F-box domain-containing protein n=1 Tax=Mycena maculata TaxID=230809 RepID=A0AAD7IFL2_9AGAR|nr:hypothetical protein DFH07DRAFT_943437 [Mycena maculata]
MAFQDLSEDTIRSISSFCDVSTVLAMGRTNRYLRRLTLEKLVWVDLVDNLRHKGFIDHLSLSEIQSQSQETLVALVKGLVNGPASWTPPKRSLTSFIARFIPWTSRQPQNRAEISSRFIIHSPVMLPETRWCSPRLLAGGEYILLTNRTLECWSVRHDKLVWSYEKNGPNSSVAVFGAEVVEGGGQVNIIICERLGTSRDRMSTSLLSDFYQSIHRFTDANVCGNIAYLLLVESGRHSEHSSILMDWQTGSRLKLAANDSATAIQVNLIPNYVLFVANNFSGTPELSLVNISALSRHWCHTTDHSTLDTLYMWEIETEVRENLALDTQSSSLLNRDLCTYESPVKEGTYKVHLQLPSHGRRHAMAYSYSLSLPNFGTQDGVIWRRTTAQPADHMSDFSGFSYSGHKLQFRPHYSAITHPGDPTQAAALEIFGYLDCVRISAYSGAITDTCWPKETRRGGIQFRVSCLRTVSNLRREEYEPSLAEAQAVRARHGRASKKGAKFRFEVVRLNKSKYRTATAAEILVLSQEPGEVGRRRPLVGGFLLRKSLRACHPVPTTEGVMVIFRRPKDVSYAPATARHRARGAAHLIAPKPVVSHGAAILVRNLGRRDSSIHQAQDRPLIMRAVGWRGREDVRLNVGGGADGATRRINCGWTICPPMLPPFAHGVIAGFSGVRLIDTGMSDLEQMQTSQGRLTDGKFLAFDLMSASLVHCAISHNAASSVINGLDAKFEDSAEHSEETGRIDCTLRLWISPRPVKS